MTLSNDEKIRYSRHLLLDDIGESGQLKLKQARVLVVGLGGLGCPVALYLAAAGVGRLTLCDPDIVDKSNLQRQVLYRDADVGQLKVVCAERQLLALNPLVEIDIQPERVSPEHLQESFDAVLDCTDNFVARQLLNQICRKRKTPLISAAALGWEGQLIAFDFSREASPCLACFIPPDADEPVLNCATAGVIGPVLGAMGSLQAITAIRILLGQFDAHGELHRFDGKSGSWLQLQVTADPGCTVCGQSRQEN